MAYYFSTASKKHYDTLHPKLQQLMDEMIKHVDFSITCGHRGKEDQDKAFCGGFSKTPWPQSKHNSTPSIAVDIAPYPIDWDDLESFTLLAGVAFGIAKVLGIPIRLGIDWDGDFNVREHGFKDRPHIELIT